MLYRNSGLIAFVLTVSFLGAACAKKADFTAKSAGAGGAPQATQPAGTSGGVAPGVTTTSGSGQNELGDGSTAPGGASGAPLGDPALPGGGIATMPGVTPGMLMSESQMLENNAIAREFAERWCENKNISYEARITVDRLLAEAQERNCLVAGAVLSVRASLDLSSPKSDRLRPIRDLRPLAVFTNLKALTLSFNAFDNIDDLAPLIKLESLNLSRSKMRKFAGLKYLHKLRALDLSYSGIKSFDLKSLHDVQQLRSLSLANNELTELPELPESLVNLDASGNKIEQIGVSLEAPSLRVLDLSYNKLKFIRGLIYFKELRKLGLNDNAIPGDELENLKSLVNLEELAINHHVTENVFEDFAAMMKLAAPKMSFVQGIVVPLDQE